MDTAEQKIPLKEFFKYVSLSVLAMIALSCYILADTYFVSSGLGTNGLSALNLAIPVYYFMHGAGLMLGMGGATAYSLYRSRGEERKANEVFTVTMYLSAVLAAVLVIVGAVFSRQLTALLGADKDTFAMTEIYIRVLLCFSPAFVLNNVFVCFVRNDGAPKLSMLATVSGSLSNILLDYVFIFPCNMGMFGAVFATGLAPVIGVCVSSMHFLRKKNNFHAVRGALRFKTAGKIFALGVPSLIEQFSSAIVILVFNFIVLGIGGNTGVAAYGVVANISLVVAAVFTGIAQGMQPILSRIGGEGRAKKQRSCLMLALATGIVFSVIIYVLLAVFAEPIADVFNREKDPELTRIAAEGMRIYFTAAIFLCLNIIGCTFFTSCGRPLPAHIISILRGLIVIIPSALVLSALAGFTGVWISYPVTEGIVAVVATVMLVTFLRRREAPENRE